MTEGHAYRNCAECGGDGEILYYYGASRHSRACDCTHEPEWDGGEFDDRGRELVTCGVCSSRDIERHQPNDDLSYRQWRARQLVDRACARWSSGFRATSDRSFGVF
jgi:hypothetical protein